MKKIMMSSILAATACFTMISQVSAAPAPNFAKHQVSYGQEHKAAQKVVVKKGAYKKFVAQNHKHAHKVVHVQNRR